MVDPLSTAAAIAGLASVGIRTYCQLNQLVRSVHSAPANIKDLAREIHEFCGILARLEDAFRSGDSELEERFYGLRVVIDNCMDKFIQLQLLIQTHNIKECDGKFSQKWKCWKWTLRGDCVAALREQLRIHKATLNIFLNHSVHVETVVVRDVAARIEAAVWEIQRLIQQEGHYTIAAPSYALQRYLSSSSISFSSLPGSVSRDCGNSDILQGSISGSLPPESSSINEGQKIDGATSTENLGKVLRRLSISSGVSSIVAPRSSSHVAQSLEKNNASAVSPLEGASRGSSQKIKVNSLRDRLSTVWGPIPESPHLPQIVIPLWLSQIRSETILILKSAGEVHQRPVNYGDVIQMRRVMRRQVRF